MTAMRRHEVTRYPWPHHICCTKANPCTVCPAVSCTVSRARTQAGTQLEITSAHVEDSGRFECRAENEAGNDVVVYELRVFSESNSSAASFSWTQNPLASDWHFFS